MNIIDCFFTALQEKDRQEFHELLAADIHFTHNGAADNIHEWATTFFFCPDPAKFISINKTAADTVTAQLMVEGDVVLPVKLIFTIVNGKVNALDAGRQ